MAGLDAVMAADGEARALACRGRRTSSRRPERLRMIHTLSVPAGVPRRLLPAGDRPRVRPFLGGAAPRLQGAALLGRFRQAALEVDAPGWPRVLDLCAPDRRLRQDARRARRPGAAGRAASLLHASAALAALLVLLAGPGFNMLFAVLVLTGLLYATGMTQVPPGAGQHRPELAAGQAGLKAAMRSPRSIRSAVSAQREVELDMLDAISGSGPISIGVRSRRRRRRARAAAHSERCRAAAADRAGADGRRGSA